MIYGGAMLTHRFSTCLAAPIVLGFLLFSAGCSDPVEGGDPDTDVTSDATSDATDTAQGDSSGADTSDIGVPDADAVDASDGDTAVGPPDLLARPSDDRAYAGVVSAAAELLEGPKADGQLGDIKMFNHHVAFIIEGARMASGYRAWGGNIADMGAYRTDGSMTEDAFGEIGFTWNLQVFEPQAVEIISDGRDGTAAHVRVTGVLSPLAFAQSFLGFIASAKPFPADATFDYMLGPEDHTIAQTVTVTNTGDAAASVDLPIILSSQGDGLFHWTEGKGFEAATGANPAIAMGGPESAHALYSRDSSLLFLVQETGVLAVLEGDFILAPGEALTRRYERAVTASGLNGLRSIAAGLGLLAPAATTITGTVALPSTAPSSGGWVALFEAGTDTPQTMGPIAADGTFSLDVDAGAYDAEVYLPGHAVAARESVSAVAGQPAMLAPTVPAAATIDVSIATSAGQPVAARVMAIVAADDVTTLSPYPSEVVDARGPGSWSWGSGLGRVSGVGYAPQGQVALTVPAGDYTIYATRGLTHSIAITEVTVTAGESKSVAMELERVVDTTGWVAGDLHIHALRSPDSYVPHAIRALQALTEDLQAPIITEHTALHGLGVTLADLGLEDVLLDIPGQEVSTVVFGHFNSFPLSYDPTAPNGGGVIEHGRTAAELFAAIDAQGPALPYVQVNHPRSTPIKGYFTYHGFDPLTGLPTKETDGWTTEFDGVEVFNGNCGAGEAFTDWVALTNMGLRKALSSGSDAHDEREIIGIPRQVAKVDYATVALDNQAFADALRQRRSIVSCGPMVTFETTDGAFGLGDLAPVESDGSVAFRVTVSAPAWQELVEVRVRRNGVTIETIPIMETAAGERLNVIVTDSPLADAWYMIEVVGTGNLWPVSSKGPPAAFTNPIEVDADGDGAWTPPGLAANQP